MAPSRLPVPYLAVSGRLVLNGVHHAPVRHLPRPLHSDQEANPAQPVQVQSESVGENRTCLANLYRYVKTQAEKTLLHEIKVFLQYEWMHEQLQILI